MLGILLVGSLVAVLVATVNQRFDALRRGHSRVLEEDHTLILGWSRQIFTIVSELAVAHSKTPHCVVICSTHDKLFMEEELRRKVSQAGKLGNLHLVVRSGDPTDPVTLTQTAIEQARSIVVLDSESSPNDTQVLRTLLAVGRTAPDDGYRQHVVTELDDPRNVAVARMTGDRRIETLVVGDLIAKTRGADLSAVGALGRLRRIARLRRQRDVLHRRHRAGRQDLPPGRAHARGRPVLGVCTAAGEIKIKPPLDSKIAAGDRLIVISVDDRLTLSSWSGAIDEALLAPLKPTVRTPERTLILGWNARVPAIVTGIDAYVAPGRTSAWSRSTTAPSSRSKRCPRACATSSSRLALVTSAIVGCSTSSTPTRGTT